MGDHTQVWNPDKYARNARFVADLATSVMKLLAPQAGERILDLGCGDGLLTRKLALAGCRVTGVDASPAFVDAARAHNLDIRLMDGQSLNFADEYDAVFSNAALHWMPEADAVLNGVWEALKPGGRFVAEMGGAGNCAAIVTALEEALNRRGIDASACNPWYFPSPQAYGERLARAGFSLEFICLEERPTRLPGDVMGWLETFAGNFIAALPPEGRHAYMREVAEDLAPRLRSTSGAWAADYVRLRFRARKTSRP